VQTLIDKGYSPLDYRYLCLGTHYRKRLLFSWELLDSAKSAFSRLKNRIVELRDEVPPQPSPKGRGLTPSLQSSGSSPFVPGQVNAYSQRFLEAINDDLNMPSALAVMWDLLRDENLSAKSKLELLHDFDKVFGLSFDKIQKGSEDLIPPEVMELVTKRTEAKKAKDFKLADELRNKVKEMGYEIVDKKEGAEVKPIKN